MVPHRRSSHPAPRLPDIAALWPVDEDMRRGPSPAARGQQVMDGQSDDRQEAGSGHRLRLAGIDFYWIVAVGLTLVALRLFIWLLAIGGLIGEADATAAFLIALPAAAVAVAWITPIDRA